MANMLSSVAIGHQGNMSKNVKRIYKLICGNGYTAGSRYLAAQITLHTLLGYEENPYG